MKQLTHQEIDNNVHKKNIVIICDHLDDKRNIGLILRLADAYGAKQVFLINETIIEIDKKVKSISRSTADHVDIIQTDDFTSVQHDLKDEKFRIIALERCDHSLAISEYDFSKYENIAVIIGHEAKGVSPTILKQSHDVLHISMYGKNSSMNVTHALAIGLFNAVQ